MVVIQSTWLDVSAVEIGVLRKLVLILMKERHSNKRMDLLTRVRPSRQRAKFPSSMSYLFRLPAEGVAHNKGVSSYLKMRIKGLEDTTL